jgi:beta-mannosidase
MIKIDLKDSWLLRCEELYLGPESYLSILEKEEGWMKTSVPCDIHMPLIENGVIKEPLEGNNFLECNWIENKSWWFKKEFYADESFLTGDIIELTMESLDSEADVFLNYNYLGHQKSAFYPFQKDIKEYIKPGRNIVLVRVTSGLEHVSQMDLAGISECVSTEYEQGRDKTGTRGDKRRAFVRKPQYAYGWDWGARVATCGIMKAVYLESYSKLAVRSVHAVTKEISTSALDTTGYLKPENIAEIKLEVEIENFHPYSTIDAEINFEIYHAGVKVKEIQAQELLKSGLNYIDIDTAIERARLWWPSGMGEQDLYTARVSVKTEEGIEHSCDTRFGIRKIRLIQDKINSKEREFAFEINGVKTFCKGANWIPADSIYARISDEKYEKLIKEAKEANFNMLRVWGGGLYEREIFYERCDEYGIMLWHDFMFACAKYPDNLEWFTAEVSKEVDYQTKRLRNHPSIVLWCGNNENHCGFIDWWDNKPNNKFYGGAKCYNYIAPQIVRSNCPEIPYWNSSPYGGESPNSNEVGDKHHWGEGMMNSDMEKRITPEEFDKTTAKFVSEYGYVGPCSKASIIRYHGDKEVARGSEIWNQHNNTFEKDTVEAGITKHYGSDKNLDLDDYLTYAGLCQGLMYGYSLEAMRFKQNCWGSLFWMYNDCWGEVGWTIIDYYLCRKPSYYFVKRAFEPFKLIAREEAGIVIVVGINDTADRVKLSLEFGYVSFDGKTRTASTKDIVMEPYSREIVLKFEKLPEDYKKGCCFIKPTSEKHSILPAVLRTGVFKELQLPEPEIEIYDFENNGKQVSFTVKSETYVHAVHFALGENIYLSDEYFDLLPGEERRIFADNVKEGFNANNIKVNYVLNFNTSFS